MKLAIWFLAVARSHAEDGETNHASIEPAIVPIDVVEAILQNVTFQEDIDEYATNDTEQFHDDDQEIITSSFLGYHQRAKKSPVQIKGNKAKKPKNPKTPKKSEKTAEPGSIDLPDPILGDEPAGRGQHRCGDVPIPPIVCVGGKCPPGFPRYDRPCNNPMELRGKFKCRAMCGPGWRIADGTPKKMKCLGKEGKPGYFKVRPKTFGHRIECVKRY